MRGGRSDIRTLAAAAAAAFLLAAAAGPGGASGKLAVCVGEESVSGWMIESKVSPSSLPPSLPPRNNLPSLPPSLPSFFLTSPCAYTSARRRTPQRTRQSTGQCKVSEALLQRRDPWFLPVGRGGREGGREGLGERRWGKESGREGATYLLKHFHSAIPRPGVRGRVNLQSCFDHIKRSGDGTGNRTGNNTSEPFL